MQILKCRLIRLALLVPLVTLLPLSTAWSLGLSEIEVDSALNEKFSATIDLMDVGDLGADEVLVSLASREDFERVGVERFFYLTDLKFSVDMKNPAKVVIISNQTISEPYLNFIVELRWPKGRLLKEFTVLLDPPTFSNAQAPGVQAPAGSESTAAASSNVRRTGDQVTVRSTPQTSPRPARALQAGEGEVVSTRDDTLWKIAQRTRASERVSVNQQMLALQKLNPNAFIRNNINLLKAGYRLQMPTESQALELDQNQAAVQVRDQSEAWRNPTQQVADTSSAAGANAAPVRSQLDATASPTPSTGSGVDDQGQVRIVANSGQLAQGSALEATEASAQLVEENATLERQVDELTYQLDRQKELAATQVELTERQLEVKDQALAELQARIAELEQGQSAQSQQQNQTATPPPEELPWWQSPLLLGGIIGVLVLLLAWLLISARRNRDDEVVDYGHIGYDEDEAAASAPAVETHVGALASQVVHETEDDADLEDEADDYLIDEDDRLDDAPSMDSATEEDSEAPASAAGASGDVIAEADIYIAYGRYGQAAALLTSTLAADPDRHDARLKLLEVCVEDEDREQFAEHAEYLLANCDDDQVLLAVRDLEGGLSERVADIETIVAGSEDGDRTDDEASGFELDDFDVTEGGESELSGDEALESSAQDAEDLASDMDFELEFDEDDIDSDADSREQISEDLGGDLGLDFDPDVVAEQTDDEASAGEPEVATDEEFDLDALDLEEASDELAGDAAAADGDPEGLNDFDFGAPGDSDVNTTKLDLAEAYIDMGDGDGARDILREVLEDGSEEQKAKANTLLEGLG